VEANTVVGSNGDAVITGIITAYSLNVIIARQNAILFTRDDNAKSLPDWLSMSETLPNENSPVEVCALDGCETPLPPRALDETGRPKGGRRPQYCGKPHADLASRQRRARDLDAVSDPLTQAQATGALFLPSARQLAEQLTELIARYDQAESGALGRVRAAEHETAQANADATTAREAAESAERDRRQALAQARQDRQARDNAIKEAGQARHESEQIRTSAWEQVAVHERSRGQAEAARAAAEAASTELAGQNRQLREQVELAQARLGELTARLSTATLELERVRGQGQVLSTQVRALEQLRLEEAERRREQVADLEQRLAQQQSAAQTAQAELQSAQTALDSERAQAQAHARDAGRLRAQLTAGEQELAQTHADLAAERSAHQQHQAALAQAELELQAVARRRRKQAVRRAAPPTTS
jgi:hypothetical protein